MSINFSPDTSGIDSLIAKYMQIERQPVVALEKRKSDLTVERAIYSDVESHLKALHKRVEALIEEKDPIFNRKAIISSDEKVVIANVDTKALLSNHQIFVERLATRDRVVSNRLETSGLGIGPGVKTFNLGLGEDIELQTLEITLEEGDTNQVILEKIAEAINNSGLKVKASVVSEVEGYSRLVLTSDETGKLNAIQLIDGDEGLLNDIGLHTNVEAGDAAGGYLKARDELDAQFILDGLTFTRSSNTVKDAISGIELRLLQNQAQGEAEVKLEVSQDVDSAKKRVQEIIDEYNRVLGYLREKTRVDGETYYRGPLANESTIRTLITRMRFMVQDRVEDSPFGRLDAIGITADDTGKLTISNESKFKEAVKSDPEGVETLFTSEKGFVVKLRGLLEPMIKGDGNYISRKKETMNLTIKSIDDRIKSYEKRMAMKEESLRREFSSMLSAMAMLKQQQNTLSSFMGTNFFGQF